MTALTETDGRLYVDRPEPGGFPGKPPAVPPRYARPLADLETTDAVGKARRWIERYEPGNGLLLVGPVGPGKSSIAGALALALGAPYRCSFWPVPDLVTATKAEFGQPSESYGITERIVRRPALVLDDIGTEASTDWQRKLLTDLVAHFYDQAQTLIATTNLDPGRLSDALGERTTSRLFEMCELVPVKGDDRRRA